MTRIKSGTRGANLMRNHKIALGAHVRDRSKLFVKVETVVQIENNCVVGYVLKYLLFFPGEFGKAELSCE